jgi:hypothetical protein
MRSSNSNLGRRSPDFSDDTPILAADIARFGEDETVIMRREGGWIRVYSVHHKADTMTTVGHIAKAMRDIDDEDGKNDWVGAILEAAATGGQGNRSAVPL